MKIYINPDNPTYGKIKKAIKNNDGFCPCSLEKTEATKCVCKEFRERETPGYCHCGLLYKK